MRALHDEDGASTRIGRLAVPFPFSVLVSIVGAVLLFLTAGILFVLTPGLRYIRRRKEERVFERLRSVGRSVTWEGARSAVAQLRGTFIEEYLSSKGPYRLWWTPDDIAQTSPFPCCFEDHPWGEEDRIEFFKWCRSIHTDELNGTARMVDPRGADLGVVARSLVTARVVHRSVCVGPQR